MEKWSLVPATLASLETVIGKIVRGLGRILENKICVTYFRGVPRCVTMWGRREGSKLVENSVTYFMDSPQFFPLPSHLSRPVQHAKSLTTIQSKRMSE